MFGLDDLWDLFASPGPPPVACVAQVVVVAVLPLAALLVAVAVEWLTGGREG